MEQNCGRVVNSQNQQGFYVQAKISFISHEEPKEKPQRAT